MLEVDKLYLCEDWYLFLYPDQKTALILSAEVAAPHNAGRLDANTCVAYYSKKYGKSLSFIDKTVVFLVMNNMENKYYEVLAGDKKGWIIYKDRLNIKEVEYGTS